MPTLDERRAALARQRDRFIGYIKEGKTLAQIADLEGIREDNAGTMRRRVAREEKLTLTSKVRTTRPEPAEALLDTPPTFRGYLADRVVELQRKHQPEDLQVILGMNAADQRAARTLPYTHNWTISQLMRLAKAKGWTFNQLVERALAHRPLGFSEIKS